MSIDLNLSEDGKEAAVLTVLGDEDGDIDISEALPVLLYVVAGLCCCATTETPSSLAATFAETLEEQVAGRDEQPRRLS